MTKWVIAGVCISVFLLGGAVMIGALAIAAVRHVQNMPPAPIEHVRGDGLPWGCETIRQKAMKCGTQAEVLRVFGSPIQKCPDDFELFAARRVKHPENSGWWYHDFRTREGGKTYNLMLINFRDSRVVSVGFYDDR